MIKSDIHLEILHRMTKIPSQLDLGETNCVIVITASGNKETYEKYWIVNKVLIREYLRQQPESIGSSTKLQLVENIT